MNVIVADVLAREAAKTQTEPHPLTLIALFCGVGLVAALIMASMGFDLEPASSERGTGAAILSRGNLAI